jgi:hypothetical protein
MAMLKDLEGEDWGRAFEAAARDISWVQGSKLRHAAQPFDREYVEAIHGISPGEVDGAPWIVYGRLFSGRHFMLEAGCSYTGWDDVASGCVYLSETRALLEQFAITADERQRMREHVAGSRRQVTLTSYWTELSEEDYAAWCAYVAAHIEGECRFPVEVAHSRYGNGYAEDIVTSDSSYEMIIMGDALVMLWGRWWEGRS